MGNKLLARLSFAGNTTEREYLFNKIEVYTIKGENK